MKIKNFVDKTTNFLFRRLSELSGLVLLVLSVLLLISLVSYSPEDPNFIFTENIATKNLLGTKGSFTSDLLFQSIGLISFLLSFTIFFTGINLVINKSFLIIIENIFYSIVYCILGSFFFTTFYPNSFLLSINGN